MSRFDRRRPLRPPESRPLTATVIVPFHDDLHQLGRCLAAMKPLPARTDLVVAADRAPQETDRVVERCGGRVVRVHSGRGPAAARNQGARASGSDILVFVDADVLVSSAALHGMVRQFVEEPTAAAVFGTYDDEPACRNFFSQYKNLCHAYVHQSAPRVARSFWAGFGAIRALVFHEVGGFDERFTRPCIEDIELGDRMAAAGHRILIDRRLHACHLKPWTFAAMVRSDICDRGIPWTKLILKSRRLQGLNLDVHGRTSVALSYGALTAALFGFTQPWLFMVAALALATVLLLNRSLYAFLYTRRGTWFAIRGAALHLLYHLYNGLSFALGTVLHGWDVMSAAVWSRRRMAVES